MNQKELNEIQYNNLVTTNENGSSTLMSMQNAVEKLEDAYLWFSGEGVEYNESI